MHKGSWFVVDNLQFLSLFSSVFAGEGQGQVLLASLKRRSHRLDRRTSLALKVIARKSYRTHAVELCRPDKKFTPEERQPLIERHMYAKDLERGNLASIPWNPFVAGIFQTFHDSQKFYMALEFIPGLTLRSRLRQMNRGFKHGEASFYFANIVCAIEFLHVEGIAHRDIKPDNILLGPDGYLCLTDFGSSAKLSQLDGSWTETGTIYYMAPECQVDPMYEPTDLPEAIDWWSSGCVLYEMVTGIMVGYFVELKFCFVRLMASVVVAFLPLICSRDTVPRITGSIRVASG